MIRRSHRPGWITILVAASAFAGLPAVSQAKTKKKKEAAAEVAPAEPPAPEAASTPPPAPAPAVSAPVPAAAGDRVSYGPSGPGTGSVTIKGDQVRVLFDGRAFGVTPVTIHDIPKGDYIIEGTTADGREVTRPVTVEEGADATVDLGATLTRAQQQAAAAVEDGKFRLPLVSKLLLGVTAGGLAVGAVFGVLELKAHGNYESATTQSAIDEYARAGRRDTRIANISFITAGAALIAAGAVAVPAFLRSERSSVVPTAVVATSGSHVVALTGVALTF
jgi:hypothetical protein